MFESFISSAVEMMKIQREIAGFLFNQSPQKAGLEFNYAYDTLIRVVHPKASQLLTG